MDYPLDTSPLTRAHRSQPGLAEKWDLYIGGIERATAYSELVDPVIQRQRFVELTVLDRLRSVFELHGFAPLETRAAEPLPDDHPLWAMPNCA